MPTQQALELLDMPQGLFLNEEGLVDFGAFRAGTVDAAGTLWQGVEAQIDGAQVSFEPMSLMLHPEEDKIPFETPWDGLTAVSVCATEGGTAPLDETRLYLAMIAYADQTQGDLTLKLAAAPKQPVPFNVHDFQGSAQTINGSLTLGNDRTLTLAGHKGIPFGKIVFAGLIATAALAWTWRSLARSAKMQSD